MIQLKVEGMTCGHCEQAVRSALQKVAGVSRVADVDRGRQLARVEGTPRETALVSAIEEEGYRAEVRR